MRRQRKRWICMALCVRSVQLGSISLHGQYFPYGISASFELKLLLEILKRRRFNMGILPLIVKAQHRTIFHISLSTSKKGKDGRSKQVMMALVLVCDPLRYFCADTRDLISEIRQYLSDIQTGHTGNWHVWSSPSMDRLLGKFYWPYSQSWWLHFPEYQYQRDLQPKRAYIIWHRSTPYIRLCTENRPHEDLHQSLLPAWWGTVPIYVCANWKEMVPQHHTMVGWLGDWRACK